MSVRWFQKLAQSAPVTPRAPEVPKAPARPKTPKLPKPPSATKGPNGHWRTLPPGHQGHDAQGNAQAGRTWVRRGGGLKPSATPMKHQADFTKAVTKLPTKKPSGLIAAHGTGTGKTFSAIAAVEKLREKGQVERTLVVAPAGLRSNFLAKGVNKFTTSKGVIANRPGDIPKDAHYVVVSYAAFRQNPDAYIDAYQPDTLIVDEAHRLTNMESASYKAIRHARTRIPRVIPLTASIVQNDPSDVVPLLNIVAGQDHTRKEFKQRYVRRVPTGQKGVFGGKVYAKKIVRQEELKRTIGPHIHYIEDLDADKKPAKEVETVEVPMNAEQLKLYRMSMKGVDPKLQARIAAGEAVSQREAMTVFTRLMRARQVSNSIHTVQPSMTPGQAADATPKIKQILDDAAAHIDSTPDAQIIMYSNMVHGGVDVLKAGLEKRGIPFGIFAGKGVKGITEETRQQAVDDYLAGKIKAIIITGAGAEGLSLGNTTLVQLVDGHYNPERISQAEARGVRAGGQAHRPQSERRVAVKRYVSTLPRGFWKTITMQPREKSVGQWVYATAERKRAANEQFRAVLSARHEHEQKSRESTLYRLFGGGP